MGLNNFDKYKNNPKIIDMEAESNYSEFKKAEKKLYELIENKNIISNISSMKNKLNRLLEYGSLKKDDIMYKSLYKNLNDVVSIQSKSQKSIEDIYNVFHTYNNFNDMCEVINGGDNGE